MDNRTELHAKVLNAYEKCKMLSARFDTSPTTRHHLDSVARKLLDAAQEISLTLTMRPETE